MAVTIYVVVGPAAGWADPTAAEVKAGQLAGGGAATWAANYPDPGVNGTVEWPTTTTGLTAGTLYRTAYVASDGATDTAVVVSAEWLTTPASVTSDLALSYEIQTTAQADLALSYEIQTAAQADLALSYEVQNAAEQDLSLAWDVINAITRDLSLSYNVLSIAPVLSAATVTNIQQTSVRPRVTVTFS